MALLTTDFFVEPLVVPGLGDPGPVGTAVTASVERYIDIREHEFLRLLMGDDMYEAFVDGLADYPVPDRWTALLNQLYDTTLHRSPVAGYVYFHWLRDQFPAMGASGDFTPQGKGAVTMGYNQRMVLAWNDMVDQAYTVYEWILDNASDYEDDGWADPAFYFAKINLIGI